ncbi:MAG: hypothetical protein JEZ11_06745 [Desulfobacterales bacterium]|nr:hypothetical protein [Desulfobacterales bacterium]
MKNAIRKAMMVLAGVSVIFAAVGNAAADQMVNVGGVEISAADFMAVKARVAGAPAGDRVYAQKADAVNVGPVELARGDFDKVRSIVAGEASVADAVVYAPVNETVNVGPAAVDMADFEAIKAQVSGGPVVRLAQRIQGSEILN